MSRVTDAPGATTFDPPKTESDERIVSVLIPVTGEPDNLGALYKEYSAPFRDQGTNFEFIFIAAPSCSMRIPELEALIEAGEPVRGLVAQTISEATRSSRCRRSTVCRHPRCSSCCSAWTKARISSWHGAGRVATRG